jgi:hypothetical protein
MQQMLTEGSRKQRMRVLAPQGHEEGNALLFTLVHIETAGPARLGATVQEIEESAIEGIPSNNFLSYSLRDFRFWGQMFLNRRLLVAGTPDLFIGAPRYWVKKNQCRAFSGLSDPDQAESLCSSDGSV